MKPAVAAALALLLSAACANVSTPTAQSSSTPGGPPVVTSTAATPSACRLPVLIRHFDVTTHTWSADTAGFLNPTAGGFTAANANGVRYDSRRDRWLPAGLPTPDGKAYVFADNVGAVHEVNLDSGLDHVIVAGSWVPLGFVGSRLYLAEQRPVVASAFAGGGYTEGGIAQTDLSGGKPTAVTQHAGPWWLSTLGAWTVDRADGLQQAPDRVLHLDLATGAVQPWLSGVGDVTVVGFDASGHPFVVSQSGVRVLLLIDPQNGRDVYRGSRENGWPQSPSYVDGDNVWFSGFSIKDPTFEAPTWLFRTDTGLHRSVGVPGAQVVVAGPCT